MKTRRIGRTPCSSFIVAITLFVLSSLHVAAQQGELPVDPSRFAEEIEAFAAEDRATQPPQGAIVATGSSSIRRWHPSIQEDLAPLTIVPRGFGGSTMADLLYWVDELVIPYNPRAVIIYEGDNDTGRYFVPPAKIVSQFESIVARIHAALPETRVYVLSVKPSTLRVDYWDKAQETNELLKGVVATNELLRYIDVATPFLGADGKVMTDIFIEDGLHLNEKGTRIWAATIKAALLPEEAQHESTN